MRRRTAALMLLLIASLGGCAALSSTEAPLLTIQNEDDQTYHLSVYVLSDVDDPGEVRFRATSEDGERRTYDVTGLRESAPLRNVTLDEGAARDDRVTIPAAGGSAASTTSAGINIWEPGYATVYVVESKSDASLVGVHVVTCDGPNQEHSIAIAGGAIGDRSADCS